MSTVGFRSLPPSITWDTSGEHIATAHFTLGVNTITAELYFDKVGDVVDFVTDGPDL